MEKIAGRYQLLKALGRGGMGEVHLARLVGLDGFEKLVVIKRVLPEYAKNPDFMRLFLDEARLASDLRHPNVVSPMDVGTDHGTLFLAMEYVHGVTVRRLQREMVVRRTPLPIGVALRIAIDIARGLAYAHAKSDLRGTPLNIVHRDVSPQNLLVGFDGVTRLLDFGIARASNKTEQTAPGVIPGKIDYMSPEQSLGGDVDGRSDQFALGIVLWELLVGDPLFPGSDTEVRNAVRQALVRTPSSLRPEVPSELEAIVLRALSKDPSARFPTCADLEHALDAVSTLAGPIYSAARVAEFLRAAFQGESDESSVLTGVELTQPDATDAGATMTVDTSRLGTTKGDRIAPTLPIETGPLIGRKRELDALAAAFVGGHLVTLLGPGGAGKTRLALAWAHRHGRELAEPAWFCDLSEARTPEGVLAAVAAGLGVPPSDDPAAISRALVATEKGLVVLDNAEQVVEPVSSSVSRWMKEAPGIRFLVTSRESLRIPGEVIEELGPLVLPEESAAPDAINASDAVRLFFERAGAVRPRPFSADESTDVGKLVRALDGMPLAIELAAARMHVLSPAQLLERFEGPGSPKRLDLLASGRRDAAARQATLRGAIEWSWNLLPPYEREALAQVSVFRGGFTLAAAEAVLAPPGLSVMDVLQSLREKSLLRALQPAGDELRFGLYESIREFAASKLEESGRRREVELRHAEHYLSSGRDLSVRVEGPGGLGHRKRLAAETENLAIAHARAVSEPRDPAAALRALRAAIALEPVMSTTGPYRFYVRVLDTALQAAKESGAEASAQELICRALIARGSVFRSQGHPDRARADLTSALEAAMKLGDKRLEGRALRGLAYVAWDIGAVDLSRRTYEQALVCNRKSGDRIHEARNLLDLAGFDHEAGRLDEARARYDTALVALRENGDRRYEGVALGYLGALLLEQGRMYEARQALDAAIATHRDGEDRRFEALFVGYRAVLHHERGELVAAQAGYARSISLLAQLGDPRVQAVFRAFLGLLEIEGRRSESGHRTFDQAATALAGVKQLQGVVEALRAAAEYTEAGFSASAEEAEARRAAGRTHLAEALAERTTCFDVRVALRLAHRAGAPVA